MSPMASMVESSRHDTIKSFLESENPISEDSFGAVGPQVIPYQASLCHDPNEGDSTSGKHSAPGFVALNYIRLAWKLEAEGVANAELLRRLISQIMIDDAMDITTELKSNSVMHIEDLLKVPIFEEAVAAPVTLISISLAETSGLKSTLSAWYSQSPKKVQAAILSRSQEIIICLRVPILDSAIYVLMDSHPRANHPDGPALTVAKALDDIMASIDDTMGKDQIILNNVATDMQFSVHCLASKPDIHKLDVKDLISRSVAYLSKRSTAFTTSEHIALLRSRAEQFRKSHRKPSIPDSSNDGSRTALQSMSTPMTSLEMKNSSESIQRRTEFGWQLALLLPPETVSSADATATLQEGLSHNKENGCLPAESSIDNSEGVPVCFLGEMDTRQGDENTFPRTVGASLILDEAARATLDGVSSSNPEDEGPLNLHQEMKEVESKCPIVLVNPATPIEEDPTLLSSPSRRILDGPDESWQGILAQQLQEEEEISMMLPHHALRDTAWLIALQKRSQTDNLATSSTSVGSNMMDWQLAVQLQQEIDIGSIDLNEREPLEGSSSSVTTIELPRPYPAFECGVCGELHNVSVRVNISGCGHVACKDCLTAFTKTKIDEGRYPIFCPECIAERPRAIRTQVSEDIIHQLDLPEEQLTRLQELQLVSHCISMQCPRCRETMNVDRTEFSEQNILVCPLPRCGHKWCKSCLKTLASSQDRHRCKNSNIERLMKRKGWKYCPGCRTPVQKEAGCNHMTCGTPGCNVHFCYKCGVLMIDTTNGGDVGTAVTDHYNECRLFDRKWKCSIQ